MEMASLNGMILNCVRSIHLSLKMPLVTEDLRTGRMLQKKNEVPHTHKEAVMKLCKESACCSTACKTA